MTNVAISCHWHKLKILWNIIWNLYQKLQHFSKTLISPIMNSGNVWIDDIYLFLFVYFIGSVIKKQQKQSNKNKTLCHHFQVQYFIPCNQNPWAQKMIIYILLRINNILLSLELNVVSLKIQCSNLAAFQATR